MLIAVLLCFIALISRARSVIYQLKVGPLPDRICVYLNRPVIPEDMHELVVHVSILRQPSLCQWNNDSMDAALPNDRRTILIVQSPDHCSLVEQWVALNSHTSARRYLAVLWAGNSAVAEYTVVEQFAFSASNSPNVRTFSGGIFTPAGDDTPSEYV